LVLVAAVSIGAFAAFNPFKSRAASQSPEPGVIAAKMQGDVAYSPLADKQNGLRQEGLQAKLNGKANGKVYKGANGQYVQLAREGADAILAVLGEFSNTAHPVYGGLPGPQHNQIPQPDRNVDNTSIWTANFSQQYYNDLLFDGTPGANSMRNFYIEQSSGRYAVHGGVTNWGQVQYNEARYGTIACGSNVCSTVWRFVNESADAWANTMSVADLNAYLAQFDQLDRYDYDHDGNFNEPDGYIDHFESIHAGEGEETGGGALGANAIWSHRWYAYYTANGPDGAGPHGLGGVRIGGSNYWIGDYTIQPENGGVGVFSHEFGHEMGGLPDEYDTSGNTGGAENGTAWWTIMSQGSYGTLNITDLGTSPVHFNAWDKFQLGWLNYDVALPGQHKDIKLGPEETNTKQAQGLFVVLPDKQVTTNIGSPFAGNFFYHSGSGNDLDNSMTRPITLGAGPASLSFQGRWQIETCWDYAYVEVSTDGGATFHSIPTSASTTDNENSQNFGNGITGTSGTPKVCDQFGTPIWVPVTADLSVYANQTIQLRFRYWTDGAAIGQGFGVDEIEITSQATDGGETDAGWTYAGFSRTTGTTVTPYFNAYVAEFRQYRGYDKSLQSGPYQFTSNTFVEHFPYQDGLLISYWDSSFGDNNVGDHPGGGLILPIDSHPAIMHWSNGATARPRIQSYDATFTLASTDAISLHNGPGGSTLTQASQAGVSTFNDNNSYWVNGDPGDNGANGRYQAEWNSVNHPHTGTSIRIQSIDSAGFMQVRVN
jgi:immune inhibitor A